MRHLAILITTLLLATATNAQLVDFAFIETPMTDNQYGHYTLLNDVDMPRSPQKELSEETSNTIGLVDFKKFEFFKEMIAQSTGEDYKIHSFRLIKTSIRKDPKVQQNYGNKIDEKTFEMVRSTISGDKFYITDVVVKCPTGHTYLYPYTAIAQVK